MHRVCELNCTGPDVRPWPRLCAVPVHHSKPCSSCRRAAAKLCEIYEVVTFSYCGVTQALLDAHSSCIFTAPYSLTGQVWGTRRS